MLIDESMARLRAHRLNIDRYRRLLRTNLTGLERDFIERRLREEQSELDGLAGNTFPTVMTLPKTTTSRESA